MRINDPVVLVTRPLADAQRFVDQLRQVAGPFEAVISPAFAYERQDAVTPDFEAAVFTSQTGVAFSPAGEGRRAYCVGNATAEAARAKGYDSVSAEGSAEELVALILAQRPSGVSSHLRGEVSRGNVSARLNGAGLDCIDVVIYRKVWLPPTEQVSQLADGSRTVVIPLFSVETVSILAGWPVSLANCRVVAISKDVAATAQELRPASITVSDAPNMASMVLESARLIA